jgi:hypothetical protein
LYVFNVFYRRGADFDEIYIIGFFTIVFGMMVFNCAVDVIVDADGLQEELLTEELEVGDSHYDREG